MTNPNAEFIRELRGRNPGDLGAWDRDDLAELALCLTVRVEELEALARSLAERCHGQSVLLSRRAEAVPHVPAIEEED